MACFTIEDHGQNLYRIVYVHDVRRMYLHIRYIPQAGGVNLDPSGVKVDIKGGQLPSNGKKGLVINSNY